MKRPTKEVRALARQAAALAVQASLDGLDAATAVMAAAIHVSFSADMTPQDVADWFRRLAAEIEGQQYGAQLRRSMRDH